VYLCGVESCNFSVEIIEIYPPYMYSIRYENQESDEYERLFSDWNDVDFVACFFEQHANFLNSSTWRHIHTPELATRQVLDEAEQLELQIEELAKNTCAGRKPDFDSYFQNFGGAYDYLIEYYPVKGYGYQNPSLIRLYAIKLAPNVYIVVDGGIKLGRSIQDSPGLSEHVFEHVNQVRSWLYKNGILTQDDL
jgi:hypothetical protein